MVNVCNFTRPARRHSGPAPARSFRKNILERDGSADAMRMYKDFRGREPSVEPLQEKRGLKESSN